MEAKIILTLKQEALEKIMKENNLTTAAELKGFLKGSYEYLDIKHRSGERYDINVETKLDYAEVIRNLADAMKKCSFTVGVDLAKPEVKEVKRPAKVGEWIKIVDASDSCGKYKNGDILQVDSTRTYYERSRVNVTKFTWPYIWGEEYVVLENYEPPKKPEVKEVKREAEVGEWIKIVDADFAFGRYKNGDILKVREPKNYGKRPGVYVENITVPFIDHDEYVVLENYNPEDGETK